jgi:hypothetical protein
MRRLLLILIALSLSPVTMGFFSCDVEGAALRPVCCCDAGVPQRCPQPASHCTSSTMTGGLQHGCCSVVVTSSIAAQDQPQAPTTMQMPVLAIDTPRVLARFQDPPSTALTVDAPRWGLPPTYLLTGRLRR